MAGSWQRLRVTRLQLGAAGTIVDTVPDEVAVEEPLDVLVDDELVTTTMRTPGADVDLVLGWLVSEGCLRTVDDLVSAAIVPGTTVLPGTAIVPGAAVLPGAAVVPGAQLRRNRAVVVRLAAGVRAPVPRLAVTSSACGVCGSAHPLTDVPAVAPGGQLKLATLLTLPDAMRARQRLFTRSGGTHAAAAFTLGGELLVLAEDVGRHNAVDKVVGALLRDGLLPGTDLVLQVSGRASYELAHKAAAAGIGVLSAVSAPSSLAVETAAAAGLTLVGFVRGERCSVYTGAQRIVI